MGYSLPNTDQECLGQPPPREMWAGGKVGDALCQGVGVGPGGTGSLGPLDIPEEEGGRAGVPEIRGNRLIDT